MDANRSETGGPSRCPDGFGSCERDDFEHFPDAVFLLDVTSAGLVIGWFNPAGERMLGVATAEVQGHNLEVLGPPGWVERLLANFRLCEQSGAAVGYDEEVELPGGRRCLHIRLVPLKDAEGRTRRLIGVACDVTSRIEAERAARAEEEHFRQLAENSRDQLRSVEEQLRQAQKMEAVGRLAGGVAHDFNNLLSVILTHAGLLVDDLEPRHPMLADLLEIKAAGERAAALTRQLLAFSRRQILRPRIVDLNQILADMERMLRRLIGEDLELVTIPAPGQARVSVDPGQMEQVLMNLAVNARDAMPDGGRLTLEIRQIEPQAADAGVHCGPSVMLAVTDTGVGMNAEVRSRMFEPFFTTKEVGKGTGLGLSTVFGIVQQSGGCIRVESEPGRGSTFRIYLPAAATTELVQPAPRSKPIAKLRGSETILVVEDDEQLRRLTRTVLERHGYQVLEAENGGEALLIAEQHPGPIHLILTDLVMPRMNGAQLAARISAARPGLAVIFMSGYTEDVVARRRLLAVDTAFIQKPYSPEVLLQHIRRTLDEAGGELDDARAGQGFAG